MAEMKGNKKGQGRLFLVSFRIRVASFGRVAVGITFVFVAGIVGWFSGILLRRLACFKRLHLAGDRV